MEDSVQVEERPNSVKISVNAKGLWSGEVKAYANTTDEAMKEAIVKAELLSDLIKTKNGGQNDS